MEQSPEEHGSILVSMPLPLLSTQAGIATSTVAGVEQFDGHDSIPVAVAFSIAILESPSKSMGIVTSPTGAPSPEKRIDEASMTI
jgi:hypothetical protein